MRLSEAVDGSTTAGGKHRRLSKPCDCFCSIIHERRRGSWTTAGQQESERMLCAVREFRSKFGCRQWQAGSCCDKVREFSASLTRSPVVQLSVVVRTSPLLLSLLADALLADAT